MKIFTEEEAQQIVDRIDFAPSGIQMHEIGKPKFIVTKNDYVFFIQCTFRRPDTQTGKVEQGFGRKYHCELNVTEKGLVMAAWMSFEQIVKHEMMECFLYNGVRLFDPHKTLEELAYPNLVY